MIKIKKNVVGGRCMKMIDQRILSEIKIAELDPNKYYIFTYDEQQMEEKEFSGYKALEEIHDAIKINFPNLRFIIMPNFKIEPREVLDTHDLIWFRDLLNEWIEESKNSESN